MPIVIVPQFRQLFNAITRMNSQRILKTMVQRFAPLSSGVTRQLCQLPQAKMNTIHSIC
jgi:hypothetical protein